jgi:hypothetical protein
MTISVMTGLKERGRGRTDSGADDGVSKHVEDPVADAHLPACLHKYKPQTCRSTVPE